MMKNILQFLYIYKEILLLLLSGVLEAQEIREADFRLSGNGADIVVSYDLIATSEQERFEVRLMYSTDGGKAWSACRSVEGAVGKDIKGGRGKELIWHYLLDSGGGVSGLLGFKIEATVIEAPKVLPYEPEMVKVSGGTFTMGSNEYSYEKPTHSVTLSDFYIGKYEVTQAQWRAVMGSDPPELWFKGCDQCPVENVSWEDVQEFLKKLNAQTGKRYRLPTEAEWEYAARGGNKSKGYEYSGGDNIDEVAWYIGISGKTHPVGGKWANELDLYDMSGNVKEWCADWYGSYPWWSASNPSGASSGTDRVLRGGSWGNYPQDCRVAKRSSSTPAGRGNGLGFRLALPSKD